MAGIPLGAARTYARRDALPLATLGAGSTQVDELGATVGHLGQDLREGPEDAADRSDLVVGHLTGVDTTRSE